MNWTGGNLNNFKRRPNEKAKERVKIEEYIRRKQMEKNNSHNNKPWKHKPWAETKRNLNQRFKKMQDLGLDKATKDKPKVVSKYFQNNGSSKFQPSSTFVSKKIMETRPISPSLPMSFDGDQNNSFLANQIEKTPSVDLIHHSKEPPIPKADIGKNSHNLSESQENQDDDIISIEGVEEEEQFIVFDVETIKSIFIP